MAGHAGNQGWWVKSLSSEDYFDPCDCLLGSLCRGQGMFDIVLIVLLPVILQLWSWRLETFLLGSLLLQLQYIPFAPWYCENDSLLSPVA